MREKPSKLRRFKVIHTVCFSRRDPNGRRVNRVGHVITKTTSVDPQARKRDVEAQLARLRPQMIRQLQEDDNGEDARSEPTEMAKQDYYEPESP